MNAKWFLIPLALGAFLVADMSPAFAQQGQGRPGQGQGPGAQGRPGGQMLLNPEMQERVQQIHRQILRELSLNATEALAVERLDRQRETERREHRRKMEAARGDREQMQTLMREQREIEEKWQRGFREAVGEEKARRYQQRMREEMQKLMEEMRRENPRGGQRGQGAQRG